VALKAQRTRFRILASMKQAGIFPGLFRCPVADTPHRDTGRTMRRSKHCADGFIPMLLCEGRPILFWPHAFAQSRNAIRIDVRL
jgi:hypothetical protein